MLDNSKYVIFISFPRQERISERVTLPVLNTILVIFDVRWAFDAAGLLSILMTVKGFNSTTDVYKVTKCYLSQKTAVRSTNNVKVEREDSNVCPQGPCFGNEVSNIQYNSLLNLEFSKLIEP